MYDFLGDAEFYEDKPVGQWGEAEFRAIFESVQRVFGPDIAWQLLFRLIQLRAGEIGEVEFNGAGNPLEAMSRSSLPGGQEMSAFIGGLMDEILDNDAMEELSDEEIEELFEDMEEEDFEDYDPEDDEDGDDDDYRERYGSAGRFF